MKLNKFFILIITVTLLTATSCSSEKTITSRYEGLYLFDRSALKDTVYANLKSPLTGMRKVFTNHAIEEAKGTVIIRNDSVIIDIFYEKRKHKFKSPILEATNSILFPYDKRYISVRKKGNSIVIERFHRTALTFTKLNE